MKINWTLVAVAAVAAVLGTAYGAGIPGVNTVAAMLPRSRVMPPAK